MSEAPQSSVGQFCASCGKKLPPHAGFCASCGNARAGLDTGQTARQTIPIGIENQGTSPLPEQSAHAATPPKSSSPNKLLIGVLAVAVIGGGVYYFLGQQPGSDNVAVTTESKKVGASANPEAVEQVGPSAAAPSVPKLAKAPNPAPAVTSYEEPQYDSGAVVTTSEAESVVGNLYAAWESGDDYQIRQYVGSRAYDAFSPTFIGNNKIVSVSNSVVDSTNNSDGTVTVCAEQTFTKRSSRYQIESRCLDVGYTDGQIKVLDSGSSKKIKSF
jgi:hypothetical protein